MSYINGITQVVLLATLRGEPKSILQTSQDLFRDYICTTTHLIISYSLAPKSLLETKC